ncbi:helix-turn-helix domain-containing protein [Bradyrhizobium genosp. A]|uniref:helix-turn-helix domain-containing protein n=1 Tax=Bradyrhizobium genosp. A TaxID=83626 RepID=UPI003CECA914
MGLRIPKDQIVQHPMRRAVLDHLIASGGSSSAAATCAALGILHRQQLAWHLRLLARDSFVRVELVGRGNQRAALIHITKNGRNAIARKLNPPAMELLSP